MPDIREEFEAWAAKHRMPLHRDDVVVAYAARCTDECWQAWQASRAALKVELPELEWFGDDDTGEFGLVEDEVREALQQAGIEVVK
ncbi:hypothetical protein [Pseudomonas aeruginosa]|uniref:hypothetical protein n=1 Tax=Pseudomonas aeruginosa TaxID=287 RepID=UPI00070E6661|nr:hypothetical protein [Pseudomonas aeruginosa]